MIRALRRCTACAALAAAVVTLGDFQEAVGAPCAPTGICQSAEVQQLGGLFGGQPLLQDSEGDGGTGTIARDVLAEIPVAGRDPTSVSGFATASVGRFGAFGLSANDFSSNQATTSTDVHIRNSDVYQNSTGAAQHLLQHLIIDGGSMSISTTVPVRNTEADFGYDILVHVGPNPLFGNTIEFREDATLITDSSGNSTFNMFHTSNLDLGIVFDPVAKVVTIPLSAQTLDLGLASPGDVVDISFDAGFALFHDPLGAGPTMGTLSAHYSDPFHLSANPALGTVAPENVAAPEPSVLALLAIGLGVLVMMVRLQTGQPRAVRARNRWHMADAGFRLGSSVAT